MPPFLRFLIGRLVSIPITLLILTALLYGIVMFTPPRIRAGLYMPHNLRVGLTDAQIQKMEDMIIQRFHLDAPYPVQYATWLANLIRGDWGYSPVMQQDVLEALLQRTPVTAELTLYSLLLFIPLGLVSGVIAGQHSNRPPDHRFRLAAFIATSLPPFILALLFLAIFYVSLHWFAPERLSIANSLRVRPPNFVFYSGLLSIDGFLNGMPDISLDALRHLVMPVVTLSLAHWATLGRVTRAAMLNEVQQEYITAARARGIPESRITWRHTFRNALAPALTSSTLSAASLVTGIYVVEAIYNFHGVSELVIRSLLDVPDAPAALGFSIYSVCVVLGLMFVLDVVQAIYNPRLREGILEG
jgi:peptide/nickel transport system permease protein